MVNIKKNRIKPGTDGVMVANVLKSVRVLIFGQVEDLKKPMSGDPAPCRGRLQIDPEVLILSNGLRSNDKYLWVSRRWGLRPMPKQGHCVIQYAVRRKETRGRGGFGELKHICPSAYQFAVAKPAKLTS